ncbi:hypothetical protein ACFLTW_00340 [Chloroflexota bacterium]
MVGWEKGSFFHRRFHDKNSGVIISGRIHEELFAKEFIQLGDFDANTGTNGIGRAEDETKKVYFDLVGNQ